MKRGIKIKLERTVIISLTAEGDEAAVNYFFDEVVMKTFGIMYELRKPLAKAAEQAIQRETLQTKEEVVCKT